MRKFYDGRTVLVTGHTGFKGTWLSKILLDMGANVVGLSLNPTTIPNIFDLSGIQNKIASNIGDIRNFSTVISIFEKYKPSVVFHLAAQPLVRTSYADPAYTFETNVMGTVNVLEAARICDCAASIVNITTDKVYENKEWLWGYREVEPLDGYDPYSNSKSCSELVTHSYNRCFFRQKQIPVSTMRAGNVIGGGDFSQDRIIPDCIKAVLQGQKVFVRNPFSIRPYQHVLEPLYAYLLLAMQQTKDIKLASAYNIGPNETDCVTTGELVEMFCSQWGDGASWVDVHEKNAPHEATFLKLDCSKIKKELGWKPVWNIDKAIKKTIDWTKSWQSGEDVEEIMNKQISEYFADFSALGNKNERI